MRTFLVRSGIALGLALAPAIAQPLGRLSAPLALIVTLPALGYGLEAFGWGDRAAARLRAVHPETKRMLVAYSLWLVTSAALTLDVAAVVAASVGLAVAKRSQRERRWQLGSAILGANLGSLLFPFSNLTNLVLVAAAGLSFAAYVEAAVAPQLLAALAGALLLVWRSRAETDRYVPARAEPAPSHSDASAPASRASRRDLIVLAIACVASVGAIVEGLTGGNVAVPFAIASGAVSELAMFNDRLTPRAILSTIPAMGVVVLLCAAVLAGPLLSIGQSLPVPGSDPLGLIAVAIVGGAIAAAVNNLPAAAFGAAWLFGAPPVAIIAFLVGTNFTAVVTPHGSVATLLARSIASRKGYETPARDYVRGAWRYGAITTAAALVALMWVR